MRIQTRYRWEDVRRDVRSSKKKKKKKKLGAAAAANLWKEIKAFES
jgi:hypothetical protein